VWTQLDDEIKIPIIALPPPPLSSRSLVCNRPKRLDQNLLKKLEGSD